MKRKIPAIIVALFIFAFMAIGSGSSSSSDEVSSSPKAVNSVASSAESTSLATIEEQVLLDENGLVITAIGMENDSIWGDGINLLIENNTNQNLSVNCNAVIVNNYMTNDMLFACSVAAGKKANDTLYFASSDLKAANITTIGQIEIYFHVYDSDSYEEVFNSDCITLQTSEYENMSFTTIDDGPELYNEDGIRIVGKFVDENSFWGTAVLLYIENNTNRNISISCENMSINGFMVTPFFHSTIYSEKMALDDITIMSSELEKNHIDSVDDIELSFHIYDADTYTTIKDTGAISFSTQQ